MKKSKILALGLSALLILTGCDGKNDNGSSSQVLEDRVPLSFSPSEYSVACTNSTATVLNYVYHLSKGEYDAALDYCIIPDGVIFDDVALQKCVLADGIGRGDMITFFNCDVIAGEADIEYDLSIGENSSTYTKSIPVTTTATGSYGIDLEASGYIASGSLAFGVPKYVHAYINDVRIDEKFLNASYCYNITKGIPKLPTQEENTDTSTSDTEATDSGITLRLETKFGISQEYPLVFQGNATKSRKSVNDDYYKSSNDLSVFVIDVPRPVRESALSYIQNTVIPKFMKDIITGTSWEDATFRSCLGPDSENESMFPDYYKVATRFGDATTDTEGRYYFYDVHSYNFEISDKKAENAGYTICVSDYNIMDIYFSCDYNYLYTRGSDAIERNATGTLRGLIQLSVDDDGNWYVHDIDSNLFKITLE